MYVYVVLIARARVGNDRRVYTNDINILLNTYNIYILMDVLITHYRMYTSNTDTTGTIIIIIM